VAIKTGQSLPGLYCSCEYHKSKCLCASCQLISHATAICSKLRIILINGFILQHCCLNRKLVIKLWKYNSIFITYFTPFPLLMNVNLATLVADIYICLCANRFPVNRYYYYYYYSFLHCFGKNYALMVYSYIKQSSLKENRTAWYYWYSYFYELLLSWIVLLAKVFLVLVVKR